MLYSELPLYQTRIYRNICLYRSENSPLEPKTKNLLYLTDNAGPFNFDIEAVNYSLDRLSGGPIKQSCLYNDEYSIRVSTYFGLGSYTINKYAIIYNNIYTIDGKSSNN